MMPTTYAKLIPLTPVPNYKYANEEAGESDPVPYGLLEVIVGLSVLTARLKYRIG